MSSNYSSHLYFFSPSRPSLFKNSRPVPDHFLYRIPQCFVYNTTDILAPRNSSLEGASMLVRIVLVLPLTIAAVLPSHHLAIKDDILIRPQYLEKRSLGDSTPSRPSDSRVLLSRGMFHFRIIPMFNSITPTSLMTVIY